jgi:micrococcal nuclease
MSRTRRPVVGCLGLLAICAASGLILYVWTGSVKTSGTPSPSVNQSSAAASSPLYEVVSVVDGDTVKIRMDGRVETIRLIGIDTPEVSGPYTQVQCFGEEASVRAHELLDGQRVRIATDPTQDTRDRYGRLLAYVWLKNGLFFNLAMIKDGFAHEYTYDLPYQYQAEFKAAERDARDNERGLWSPSICAGDTAKPAGPATVEAPAANSAAALMAPPLPSLSPRSGAYVSLDAPPPDEPWLPCARGQVKGNAKSGAYHRPGQRDYAKTYAKVQCFNSAEEAAAAGYRPVRQ